jgi:hypothetical protein
VLKRCCYSATTVEMHSVLCSLLSQSSAVAFCTVCGKQQMLGAAEHEALHNSGTGCCTTAC